MANIPIPQSGQPIDYSYIYQIVETLNELSTKVSSKFSESEFDNGKTKETHRLNDMVVVAGYVEIPTKSVTSSSQVGFRYNFKNNFKYFPVVTATPKIVTNNATSQDVSVVIYEVTTSYVSGYVAFNSATAGQVSIGVNIIAVGIPGI